MSEARTVLAVRQWEPWADSMVDSTLTMIPISLWLVETRLVHVDHTSAAYFMLKFK